MTFSFSARTDRQIEAAKVAQAKRLGQAGAFGKRKKCLKGKSCGASCISNRKVCLVDLPWVGQQGMNKLVKAIESLKPQTKAVPPSIKPVSVESNPGTKTLDARAEVEDIILNLNNKTSPLLKINGELAADKVDWDSAYLSGSERLGKGAFGAFMAVPNDKLGTGLSSFKDGVGIKVGKVGQNEASIIKIAGDNGVGPKLIAAKTGQDFRKDSYGYTTADGMIAMGRVPGKPVYKVAQTPEIAEAFWQSRAVLHTKAGIAHNDMHGGNALVDKTSKGTNVKFVDFGLASTNPKAVLVEALGGVTNKDYQVSSNLKSGDAFNIVKANFQRVEKELQKDGFSEKSLRTFFDTTIRKEDSFFKEGAWGKMTDAQAKKYVKMLYQNI